MVSQKESTSTNIGAIVGGVVGGVALLAIIGLAAFLIRRRRRNRVAPGAPAYEPYTETKTPIVEDHKYHPQELPPGNQYVEAPSAELPHELPAEPHRR